MGADALLDLLEQTDALRRPERFEQFLAACAADYHGRPGYEDRPFAQADRLRAALAAAKAVDAGAIATGASQPGDIPVRIRQARQNAIAEVLQA